MENDQLAIINKPPWLTKRLSAFSSIKDVEKGLRQRELHTICEEGNCPNLQECFARKEASLLIMGDTCTRFCKFCGVHSGHPQPLDPSEPHRVAEQIKELGLKFVVITSVTRDDLPDGGSGHFVETAHAILKRCDRVGVELLIPDFLGSRESLKQVLEAQPQVLSHNIETVPRLYSQVRRGADYQRSLNLLAQAARHEPRIVTKSSLMLGLGEDQEEVLSTMRDLRDASCDIITIGQYLSPSAKHHPVSNYIHPDEFQRYKEMAYFLGFKAVASAPLVRSSYQAGELYQMATKSLHLSKTSIKTRLMLHSHLPYLQALELMRRLVEKVRIGGQATLIVCEHEPVLTLGRHSDHKHILVDRCTLKEQGISVHQVERGGQVTYHGPGQVIAYPILKLTDTGFSVKQLVKRLEQAIIKTLSQFGVTSQGRDGFPGVWVGDEKIASIGMAVKEGVTLHGLAINNAPDLKSFGLINPCGFKGVQMTSIANITGNPAPPEQLRKILCENLALEVGLIFV